MIRTALRFACEWRDDAGNGLRSYGNEDGEFDEPGCMHRRFASINDRPIRTQDRGFHGPPGRRPDDHACCGPRGAPAARPRPWGLHDQRGDAAHTARSGEFRRVVDVEPAHLQPAHLQPALVRPDPLIEPRRHLATGAAASCG